MPLRGAALYQAHSIILARARECRIKEMADAPLYTSTRERRRQTDLADFYALLKASEAVEKAYARGAVSAADYEKACSQLVAQFRASEAALTGDGTIASTEAFFQQWRVDCPRAAAGSRRALPRAPS